MAYSGGAVEVNVEVECADTAMGDNVALIGGGASLGDWNPARSVKLNGAAFPLWRGTVSVKPGTQVEYKYVILRADGGVTWEPLKGDANRVRRVEAMGSQSWRDGKFGKLAPVDTVNTSSGVAAPAAVQGLPSGGYGQPAAPAAVASVPSNGSAQQVELCFVVECADTSPGDCIAVAGSWDWNAEPLKFDGAGFPTWRGVLRTSQQRLEYKYLLLGDGGKKQWEPMEGNRMLEAQEVRSGVRDDGKLKFDKGKSRSGGGGNNNNGSIIVAPDKTIYGKVTLDYGTLEVRMVKRMDQPTQLNGDHDQQLHDHNRHHHRVHLEGDFGALEHGLKGRAAAWPSEFVFSAPPSTNADVDSAPELAEIVAFEGRGSLTLHQRFKLAHSILERAPEGSASVWTVLVWLRFSQARQLSWQRKENTRPLFLSEAAAALSELISRRWGERPKERNLWRMLLAAVPRGSTGADGQAIRDEILVIMQKHQLKKRKGDFMEQWHQKLHNNTTPDDIHICEAYLIFLRSEGDTDAFYAHLEEHGINRERLQTFDRPIIQEPIFFPSIKNALINDFERYLVILKNVHAGADLEKSVDAAAYGGDLDGGLRAQLESIIAERSATGDRAIAILGAIVAARSQLRHNLGGRDKLYLDLALEAHARLIAERLGSRVGTRAAALSTALLIENLGLSHLSPEVRAAFRDFAATLGCEGSYEMLRAAAAAERTRGTIAGAGDTFVALQQRAEMLGTALRAVTPDQKPDKWAVDLFAEEAARGGPGFAASLVLTTYERRLRETMGGSSWQLVSVTQAQTGKLFVMSNMSGDQQLESPSIILTETLGGEEDPPEGTVAVLTPSAVDVLSHVAVRARTMGIFLATCFDEDCINTMRQLQGRNVCVTAKAGTVVVEEAAKEGIQNIGAIKGQKKVLVTRPPPSTELWVPEGSIGTCVAAGAKSRNLVSLRAKLPAWVKLPMSAVVPFGVLEKVLSAPENSSAAAAFNNIVPLLQPGSGAESVLQQIGKVIKGLKPPAAIFPVLCQAVQAHGASSGDEDWWSALTAVWASSWSSRAFHACHRAGIQPGDIAMSVLVQVLVPAQYAFVIHTRHPTGDPEDLYAEVVVGLGEVLVGNHPGRALSFTAPRNGSGPPRVTSLPSKGLSLSGSGLIFRSDSNAEDLEAFAGAGLFDSVPVQHQQTNVLEYLQDPLVCDLSFQRQLLDGIARLAMVVEAAVGGAPQDIEGCFSGGEFFVVQTRPQA